MARFISNLLLLTIQYVILNCTKRTLKLVYKPYGPKMCRQSCEDLGGSFYYVPEDLSCHRIPIKDPAGSIMDPLKACLMEDIRANHVPSFTHKIGPNVCNNPSKEATPGSEHYTDPVNHNISLHQACAEGRVCTVQFILSQRPDDINTQNQLGKTPVMAAVMKNQIKVFDFLVSKNCDLMVLDNNNDTVLHVACDIGNVDTVRKLVVNHTCDTESRGWEGTTPVMRSALHGHRDVVDLLVSNGCNVKVLDVNKNNILHVACSGGHVNVVKYVLRKLNFNVESRGQEGRTPVMIAALGGHIGVFGFLARYGSNLLAFDNNSDNILHVACIGGHVDMVQYILNKTLIDIESKARHGRTPVMRAAEYGKRSVVNFLARKGCNLTAVDDTVGNVLHVACVGGHVDMVKHILLKMKIPIDSRGQVGNTPVMTAVRQRLNNIVKYLVRKGCNLTILNDYGNNVLHVACTWGHVDMVKYILLQRKIPKESIGQHGFTPVLAAAFNGQVSVVKYLMSEGCFLMAVDNNRNNALHLACVGGHLEMVKYIFAQKKISIESIGQFGFTPVMAAVNSGHVEVVRYLVSKGCKLTTVAKTDCNILHLACIGGHLHVVKYILSQQKIPIDSRGKFGRTAVMDAVDGGHLDIIRYLVSEGCKLTIVNNAGDNILHLACFHGHVDIVKYILSQHTIPIDSIGQFGRTPVIVAAFKGHVDVVEYLVSKGCKLMAVNNVGNNILHVACTRGHLKMVKYILSQQKMLIESIGQFGFTPVLTAANNGHVNVVEYLVSKGCKLMAVNHVGNNILHVACAGGHLKMVKYILSRQKMSEESIGQFGFTPVMTAAYSGHVSVVKYLVSKACKLMAVDKLGNNILHVACTRGHLKMVKYILSQQKTSIDIIGQYGFTPVMTAANSGHVGVVKYLVSKGCKLTTVDKIERNILHVVCYMGHMELVKYILSQQKVSIDSRGQYRWTPLMYAAYYGHTSVVKYLVGKGCNLTFLNAKGGNVFDVACMGRHEDVVKFLVTIKSWPRTC